jgi:hypothetical protein
MLSPQMFGKWLAVVLVVLAASPVTAPFQTYDIGSRGTANDTFVVEVTTSMTDGADPGSLLPLLKTQPGRLKIAPDFHAGLVASCVVGSAQLICPWHCIVASLSPPRVNPLPSLTVLRL